MDDESSHRVIERDKRARQDHDDANNEMAGRDVARQKRFRPRQDTQSQTEAKKRAARERRSALLRLLATDAAYAALYDDTLSQLRQAEIATELARETAETAVIDARQALDDLTADAATLLDGTKVFRDQDGQVRDADGNVIRGADLDAIEWRGGEPSYEDLKARQKALADAQMHLNAILRYQTDTLGTIRDKITDEDNPPSADELKDMQQQIEDQMPDAVAQIISPELPSPAAGAVGPAPTDMPKL